MNLTHCEECVYCQEKKDNKKRRTNIDGKRLLTSPASSFFWSRDWFNGSSEEEEILWLMLLLLFVSLVHAARVYILYHQEPLLDTQKQPELSITEWKLISASSTEHLRLILHCSCPDMIQNQPPKTALRGGCGRLPSNYQKMRHFSFC